MKLNNVNKIIFIMFHKKQQEDINKNEKERNHYRQKKEDEREIILTRLSQNFQLVWIKTFFWSTWHPPWGVIITSRVKWREKIGIVTWKQFKYIIMFFLFATLLKKINFSSRFLRRCAGCFILTDYLFIYHFLKAWIAKVLPFLLNKQCY